MPAAGFDLPEGLMETLTTNMGGIIKTIMNLAPKLMFAGIGVWGITFAIKKIPGWFKKLVK